MFFMFIFATEKIKEMKKTILFSILSVLTFASAWAVSYPDQGLLLSNSSEEEFVYLPGAGNFRSIEQVGQRYQQGTNEWEGSWGGMYSPSAGGGTTAEVAMGDINDYVESHLSKYLLSDNTFSPKNSQAQFLEDVTNDCLSKEGTTYLDCRNYAVDAYNLIFSHCDAVLGESAVFIGYYTVPVSTDIAFMALMLAAYLGFAAYRKKHFLAKA